jgi:CCR4-NOT transcription complex subunit 1
MCVALDKDIKEIILPVVERSVTIASKTTKELVMKVSFLTYVVDMLLIFYFLKNYAMESEYNAANRVARLMVETLAGSLAHVTCKVLLACF